MCNAESGANQDEKTYSSINTGCPLCDGEVRTEGEQIPQSYDYHEVGMRCKACGFRFKIEYRAIDISWTGGAHEYHSAVSQGIIEPSEEQYSGTAELGPLPPAEALKAIDFPVECDCGEDLTPNHVVAGPDARETIEDSSETFNDDVTPVDLLCPMCEEETVVSAG
ncbi:hypothetical protein HLRTI_002888 [Halorhabdus tiamatea SARL4B]|uniref:Uncharacterized protein n=1 Tax=Halorhabdus tiamatea SARL4B TaxID=1033806 RepID=U2F9B0_9EURY|nr:hypothetical protein [Halorhabdus tiamatea]ERJ05089.1 hypothetical protein HLRTI_002888 [Halorhabdus tiamatea SARL4B]